MNTPKSMQPPEVKGTSQGVTGFVEFEQWAARNVPIWNSARHYCAMCGLPPTEYLKLVAYHLTLENRRMIDAEVNRLRQNGSAPIVQT